LNFTSKNGHLETSILTRINYHSNNHDEFGEMLKVAHIEEKLLEKGSFYGKVNMVFSSHVMVANLFMNRKILQKGTALANHITFVVFDPEIKVNWRKHEMNNGLIGVLWKNDHESVTGSGFNGLPVTIDEKYFIKCCRLMGYPKLEKKLNHTEIIKVPTTELEKLRKLIKYIAYSKTIDDRIVNELMEIRLVNMLIHCCLDDSLQTPFIERTYSRFADSIDYIHENISNITSIHKISANTGIPERALRRMFQKKYDLSPKSYINNLRLNEVRKRLKLSNGNIRISKVAGELNFWHMGQFSKDYKILFGELPSETLKKNKHFSIED